MDGVSEFTFVGLDGLTVDLVRPASVISDGSNGSDNVRILGPLEGLAYVRVPAISARCQWRGWLD